MKHANLLLVVALLFCVAWTDCTETPPPPEDTGTPWLQTQYPPTDTVEPTPTSPPEWTDTPEPRSEPTPTVGVSPDPSPTTPPGTGTPDREKHKPTPTPNMVMPKTGLPLLPTFFLGFAFFALAFIVGMVRRVR
jgi:hypothetical protein